MTTSVHQVLILLKHNINNMETHSYLHCILYVVFASFTCCVISSCIKDSDDDDITQLPHIIYPTPVPGDSTDYVVDSTFATTKDFLTGNWMAQYTGFDPMQGANSAIRRHVSFSADGSYDSHVQGVNGIQQDSSVVYREFEHEHGTYSFDVDKQLMTYHVEYDSILNFFTDRLEYNAGKVVQGVGIMKEYDEEIRFSLEKEGKRDWIRIDDNLRQTANHSSKVIYIMRKQ